MPTKLIVTDLDNTLLRRDKSVSGYIKSVFERLCKRGILIAFATSRSERASARFRTMITPDINITSGGAIATMNGQSLFRAAIDDCKTVVDCVCGDCDDDGVARWLEENVL